jgi:hypothetical protein
MGSASPVVRPGMAEAIWRLPRAPLVSTIVVDQTAVRIALCGWAGTLR